MATQSTIQPAAILVDPPADSNWIPTQGNVGFQLNYHSNCSSGMPRIQTTRKLKEAQISIEDWIQSVRAAGLKPVFLTMNLDSEETALFRSHDEIPLLAPDIFPELFESALDFPDGDWTLRYWSAMGQPAEEEFEPLDRKGTGDFMWRLNTLEFGKHFREWLEGYLDGFENGETMLPESRAFTRQDWVWDGSNPYDGRLVNKHCPAIMLGASWNHLRTRVRISSQGTLKGVPDLEGLVKDSKHPASISVPSEVLRTWLGEAAGDDAFFSAPSSGIYAMLHKFSDSIHRLFEPPPAFAAGLNEPEQDEVRLEFPWGSMVLTSEISPLAARLTVWAEVQGANILRLALCSKDHEVTGLEMRRNPNGRFYGEISISRDLIPEQPDTLRITDQTGAVTYFQVDLLEEEND